MQDSFNNLYQKALAAAGRKGPDIKQAEKDARQAAHELGKALEAVIAKETGIRGWSTAHIPSDMFYSSETGIPGKSVSIEIPVTGRHHELTFQAFIERGVPGPYYATYKLVELYAKSGQSHAWLEKIKLPTADAHGTKEKVIRAMTNALSNIIERKDEINKIAREA